MKRAMTKKIIAAVLAMTMLLSNAVTVFANPAWPERDPNAEVSLYVHHLIGTLANPVDRPGPWVTPTPPTTANGPAEGTIWRAARILAPVGFVVEIHGNTPPTTEGAGTLPAPVINAILNGWVAATPDAQGRHTIFNAATGNVPLEHPVAGEANRWYITSDGDTALVSGTDRAHIPGAHQVVTNNLGIARFSPEMTRIGLTADRGHGLWLVWEAYNSAPIPDSGPGSNDVRTPYYGIVPPFLVNLPTFMHEEDFDDLDEPGEWLYRVHVFPKMPAPVPTEKPINEIIIGSRPDDDTNATRRHEYTLISWDIRFGVPDDIARMQAVPAANLRGPDATVNANTRIFIQDILDYRLRLLPSNYEGFTAYPSGLPVAAPVNTGNVAHPYWLQVTLQGSGATPAPRPFPQFGTVGSGAEAQEGIFWEFRQEIVPEGSPMPWPNVSPVPTPVNAEDDTQIFYIHITQLGTEWLAANRGDFVDPVVNIHFFAIAEDIGTEDLGNLYNEFAVNFGNRPTTITEPGDDDIIVMQGLTIRKINPSDQLLDGAVFFLFRCYQMTGLPGSADRVPMVGELPHRVAISGGVAGNTINMTNIDDLRPAHLCPVLTGANAAEEAELDARWEAYKAIVPLVPAASPAPGTGLAVFNGLPTSVSTPDARNNWYLFELMAPAQYRRVEGHSRVVMGVCRLIVVGDPLAHNCLTDECNYDVTQAFTNTRGGGGGFQLPMTGGAGTIVFTTAGVSLMGIAGLFLFLARKKDKNKVSTTSFQ